MGESHSLNVFKLRVIGKIGFLKRRFQNKIKDTVQSQSKLQKLNKSYLKFNDKERLLYQGMVAKVCVGNKFEDFENHWNLEFEGKDFQINFNQKNAWLRWDTCLSILGNDIEVKNFYRKILRSEFKPKVFFDVGANYCTHSFLMAVHDVDVYSFEPNPNCREFGEDLFSSNNLNSSIIAKGVGAKNEKLTLSFPDDETWNGTFSITQKEKIGNSDDLSQVEVDVIKLGDFCNEKNIIPDLIKIDTEGFEANVVIGAKEILRENAIDVVFESIERASRKELYNLFDELNYRLFDISSGSKLSQENFLSTSETNFLASKDSEKIKVLFSV